MFSLLFRRDLWEPNPRLRRDKEPGSAAAHQIAALGGFSVDKFFAPQLKTVSS